MPCAQIRDKTSGIMIDVSFAAASGLVTRALINDLITRYPAVRPLVLVLKYFLIQVRRGAVEEEREGEAVESWQCLAQVSRGWGCNYHSIRVALRMHSPGLLHMHG